MVISILDFVSEFIQAKLCRAGDHLRTRNLLQFFCVPIAIALIVLWHVDVVRVAYRSFIHEEVMWSTVPYLWLGWLFVVSVVDFVLFKIYFLNWSWEKAKQEIRMLPWVSRFVSALVVGIWALAKLLLFLDQTLPVSGYFGDLSGLVSLAELDILLPFGVIGAVLFLVGRSGTQDVIAGLKKASPEERMEILSLLGLEKSQG